jgi:hypothetical protein
MDVDPYRCICGRSFLQAAGLNYHNRSCKKVKTHLAGALDKAKEVWVSRKRRRLEIAATKKSTVIPQAASTSLPNADDHNGPDFIDAEVCMIGLMIYHLHGPKAIFSWIEHK